MLFLAELFLVLTTAIIALANRNIIHGMRTLTLLVLACLGWLPALSGTIVISPGMKEARDVNRNTYIVFDVSRKWTIDSITSTERFGEQLEKKHNIGFMKGAVWTTFTIANRSGKHIRYIYSINMSLINEVSFYEYKDDTCVRHLETGELKPISTRDIPHRRFAFAINIPDGEQRTYFMRLYNDGDSISLPISLKDQSIFFDKDFYDSMLMGLYFGLLLFIIIFNIFYIISLRERLYLYYTQYLIFATLFILNMEGFSSRIFPPFMAPTQDIMTVIFVSLGSLGLVLFNSAFFAQEDKGRIYPFVCKVFISWSILCIITSVLPNPYYLISVLAVNGLTLLTFVFLLITAAVMYHKKVESAKLFLGAFSIGLSGVLIFVFRDFAVIPDNFWTEHAMKMTFLLESLTFFFAIMVRIRKAREKTHSILVEKNILLNRQQEELSQVNKELEKLSIVASETDNSVAIYSAKGVNIWYNDGFRRIFCNEHLLDGRILNISQIYPNPEISELVQIAVSLKESVVFETLISGSGASAKWIYTTLTPILDNNGFLVKLIAIDSDISELKKTQQDLEEARDKAEEANRLKTAFLSNVSHELRTPLNSIIGFSQLLLMKEFNEQKRTSFLKLINDNGNHLLNLISDIIDISKIESGHMQLQLQQVDINRLVNDLYEQFAMQTKNSGKEFEIFRTISLPDKQAFLETDIVKLRQVLLNLLGNSIKFTHTGHIHFGYLAKNGEIEFFVEDTGIGLTKEEVNIVFHRFRQADDSITRKYGGTGLGLSISKGLIELLGGKLKVESEKDKGTRISFTFKQTTDAVLEAAKQEAALKKSSKIAGKKILVVEDDPTNFDFMEEVLSENNAIVYHAATAAAAMNIFEDVALDLILLDIQLPDKNGYELAELFRLQNKEIPIIAQTAYAYEEAKRKCMDSGCTDYISKPIEYQLLIGKLEKYLS